MFVNKTVLPTILYIC